MEVSDIKSSFLFIAFTYQANNYTELIIFTILSILTYIVNHTMQIWSDRNFRRFILHGMIDHTSLIWNVST